jgi:hypothetical protein
MKEAVLDQRLPQGEGPLRPLRASLRDLPGSGRHLPGAMVLFTALCTATRYLLDPSRLPAEGAARQPILIAFEATS